MLSNISSVSLSHTNSKSTSKCNDETSRLCCCCNSKMSKFECIDCVSPTSERSFCSRCSKDHSKIPEFSEHILVPLTRNVGHRNKHCEHGREKRDCVSCGGSRVCKHQRLQRSCRECGGSRICSHGKYRHVCKDCGGSGICEHNKVKYSCSQCKKISKSKSKFSNNKHFEIENSSPSITVAAPSSAITEEHSFEFPKVSSEDTILYKKTNVLENELNSCEQLNRTFNKNATATFSSLNSFNPMSRMNHCFDTNMSTNQINLNMLMMLQGQSMVQRQINLFELNEVNQNNIFGLSSMNQYFGTNYSHLNAFSGFNLNPFAFGVFSGQLMMNPMVATQLLYNTIASSQEQPVTNNMNPPNEVQS